MLRRPLAVLAVVVMGLSLDAPATAQDPTSSSTTVGAPAPDIVPEPNSGAAPSEAGDRGGALQLGLLAVVLVVIGTVVGSLVRQSRRER